MSSYINKLVEFSSKDSFINLLGNRVFSDPVYLCKSVPELINNFEIIKDYVINHISFINDKSSFEVGSSVVVPISIRTPYSEVDAIFISSDDVISIVVDKSDLSDLLQSISDFTKHEIK